MVKSKGWTKVKVMVGYGWGYKWVGGLKSSDSDDVQTQIWTGSGVMVITLIINALVINPKHLVSLHIAYIIIFKI